MLHRLLSLYQSIFERHFLFISKYLLVFHIVFHCWGCKTIEHNVLGTCQYIRRDIRRRANKIWDPSGVLLKGKSTARKGKMDTQDKVVEDIPSDVMSEYRDVQLDMDKIFVSGVSFLRTISRHLCMTNARAILNWTYNRVKDVVTAVRAEYEKRLFNVKTMHDDKKNTLLKDWLGENGITLDTCDTNQHVP